MYIMQIADLHIGSETKRDVTEKEIMQKSIYVIREHVAKGENLLICVCGDIIDSKGLEKEAVAETQKRYAEAADILRELRDELQKEYQVQMRFCLGNHDVTHVDEYVESVRTLDPDITKEALEGCFTFECDGTYFVFANSCHGAEYKYGCIDYPELEACINGLPEEQPKILVLHHTIISMYEKDASSIRESAKLLNIIEKNNVIGVLHGHIHGRENLIVGEKKCRVIGTGALFSRNNPDVNSQFNLIELKPYYFREIATYIYTADSKSAGKPWRKISSDKQENENYFKDTSFEAVYRKLTSVLSVEKVINNVVLQINSPYTEFADGLTKFLEGDELCIGQKKYSYPKLAEMWEAIEVPQELYFNHGMYFRIPDVENDEKADMHAIQQIARQLKAKPTGNSAVLATCSMATMVERMKGKEYIPSLLSIQFGQDKTGDTLYVHMYLRALEAERFLKINICEIKWLLERLKENNVLFKNVDIVISAFRVQSKKDFSCFLKTDIDVKSTIGLAFLVFHGEVSEICKMLEEKKDASETITNVSGLKRLYDAMKETAGDEKAYRYSESAIAKLEEILDIYQRLDELHNRGSVKTEEEDRYEREIREKIGEVIQELETKTVEEKL